MEYNIIDISSGTVTLALAAVLLCLSIPDDRHWDALRRTLRLLSVGYICMGLSNLITGSFGVSGQDNTEMGISIVLVSMFQALFFTATCLAFVSPGRVGVRWLTTNVVVAASLCGIAVFLLVRCGWAADWVWAAVIIAYTLQLVYYCHLFRCSYTACVKTLEANYEDELVGGLRWIGHCFIGALIVGVSALLFALFRCGGTMYAIFTSVYTLYYIYLVVCVVNYRIEAGYIVKVVASDAMSADGAHDGASATPDADVPTAAAVDVEAERSLAAAIDKWVMKKGYIRNDQTVEEIAAELDTTHAMLKWYFANRMRTTFRTWRLNLRVEEAKRLLREEGVPTSAVHAMVGVADKSNFHKLFRKLVGMTPTEYKEKARH